MGLYHPYQRLKKQQYRPQKKVRPIFLYLLILSFFLPFLTKLTGSSIFTDPNKSVSYTKADVASEAGAKAEEVAGISAGFVEGVTSAEQAPQILLEGRIDQGGSIYQCLHREGVSDRNIQLITDSLNHLFSFRTQSRPGDLYRLSLTHDGEVERFEYQTGPLEIYCLGKDKDDRWDSWRENIKLAKYWIRVSGQIKGSLFSTLQEDGYPASLAIQFAEILEWKIDFQHEVRDGDRFDMVVERFFKGEEPIGYGRIVAVVYDGVVTGMLRGFYFDQGEGRGDYYNDNGMSLRQAFLKAPLSYKYISSGFSYNRKHPVLGCIKPHLGIDFAAPYGSPVWAVADGTVISKTYDRCNGNQIKLRHMNNYITYYNHLSKFAKGLHRGERVNQKQVIGYVGTTGLSTGSHLDYRVKKDGKFINPLTAKYPSGKPLKEAFIPEFKAIIANLEPILTADTYPVRVLVAEVDSSEVYFSM